MSRPVITKGKTGIGNFGVGVMPDGTSNTLRVLIKPDGFHFVESDFDDLTLSKLSITNTEGGIFDIGFDRNGNLIVNNDIYTTPTNNKDELISGEKTFNNEPTFKNGFNIIGENGSVYKVDIDNSGNLNAKKINEA